VVRYSNGLTIEPRKCLLTHEFAGEGVNRLSLPAACRRVHASKKGASKKAAATGAGRNRETDSWRGRAGIRFIIQVGTIGARESRPGRDDGGPPRNSIGFGRRRSQLSAGPIHVGLISE
jgi:hypothetical protein